MEILGLASNATGVADIAGRALYQVYNLFDIWTSAPREVIQLGNTVGAVRQLMDSLTTALEAGQSIHTDQTIKDLLADVAAAGETLRQLESILTTIEGQSGLPGTTIATPHASAKARWAMHRASLSRLQSTLNDCQQRIITRLQIWNV